MILRKIIKIVATRCQGYGGKGRERGREKGNSIITIAHH